MGLWTSWHAVTILPTFAVFIVIAIFFGKWLRGKSEKIRYLPFQIMAALLLVLEVAKQINAAKGGTYDLYALPFHYCSLFLYVLPFHAFYKGKGARVFHSVAFSCCASLFMFMLVMPAIVYSDAAIQGTFKDFTSFHTVIFHNLVCFYFLLMVTAKTYEAERKLDMKVMTVFFGSYVVIAAILSHALKVNFHNLYRCNLGFVEEIRLAVIAQIGWVGQLLYVLLLLILTILFAYLAYFATLGVLKLVEKLTRRKES